MSKDKVGSVAFGPKGKPEPTPLKGLRLLTGDHSPCKERERALMNEALGYRKLLRECLPFLVAFSVKDPDGNRTRYEQAPGLCRRIDAALADYPEEERDAPDAE